MSQADPAIVRVHAREVLDSRGRPTVEVEVTCRDGSPRPGHRAVRGQHRPA